MGRSKRGEVNRVVGRSLSDSLVLCWTPGYGHRSNQLDMAGHLQSTARHRRNSPRIHPFARVRCISSSTRRELPTIVPCSSARATAEPFEEDGAKSSPSRLARMPRGGRPTFRIYIPKSQQRTAKRDSKTHTLSHQSMPSFFSI